MSVIAWSIGLIPVQEWIAEARRSRDLKIGSAMLSWLMAVALERVVDDAGVLFVPSLDRVSVDAAAKQSASDLLRTRYGIPNRASGWWPGKSLADVAGALKELQGRVDAKWDDLRKAVEPTIHPGLLRQYLQFAVNPVRVIWCAQPLSAANPDQLTRQEKVAGLEQIEQLYQAVKRTRPITPHQGTPVGKCGQCAKREATGPSNWNKWRGFQTSLEAEPVIRKGLRLDVGERLCAVCLLKRFAGYATDEAFPSTSEIASRDWLFRVQTFQDLLALVAQWRTRAEEVDEDDPYPLLYARTVERRLKATPEAERPPTARVGQTLRELSDRIEHMHPELPKQPSEYLAVVTFDGDDMGRAVQTNPDRIPAALLAFASRLGDNAQGVFRATPFYLGGDEGLLLCPVETCMELAANIQKTFALAMEEALPDQEQSRRPTISVGIAVFDRERPLGAAIKSARDALEGAKGLDGKNGLGINVSTASGNSWTALDHWGEGWQRVVAALELVRARRLSSGWAYDVETLLETLPPSFFEEQEETGRDALRAEVRRITYRRTIPSPEARDADDRMRERAAVWERLLGPAWWAGSPDTAQRDHAAAQLHLIAFLARELQTSVANEAPQTVETEAAL